MPTYTVELIETNCYPFVAIEANSKEEAEEKYRKLYDNNEILPYDIETEIKVRDEKEMEEFNGKEK